MTEPIYRRRFQMTDLIENTNKYWQVEVFNDGWLQTEYGRVGVVNKPSRKRGDVKLAEKLIREKERKGYTEVKLHVVEVVTKKSKKSSSPMADPYVQALLELIQTEAGKKQQSYLRVGIEELSQGQIDDARVVLQKASDTMTANAFTSTKTMLPLCQLFYTLIPTKLPARIEPLEVAANWLNNLSEMEDRLNQLSAGISNYKRRVVQDESGIALLGGTEIQRLEIPSDEHHKVYEMIRHTKGYQGYQVQDIFRVKMPNERKRYEDNDFGKSREQLLFHGTNNYNLQFILSEESGCGGLIVPKVHSHGRYYGDGIYFSPESQKSYNYTHTTTGLVTLLVCNVALGKEQLQDGGCHSRQACDPGYESLRSLHTPSGMTEILVYRNEQSTVSYIATAK